MDSAFQADAFQVDAFQIAIATTARICTLNSAWSVGKIAVVSDTGDLNTMIRCEFDG